MGAPLKYELECGHCGSVFTLEEGAVTRQVRCPVCGGALTVAVPIPIIPIAPAARAPTAPPPPAPPPVARAPEPAPPAAPVPPEPEPIPVPAPGFPALAPTPPDLDHLTPELRARHLRSPWPSVRVGLALGRASAYIALPLCVLFLCVGLLVLPIVPAGDRGIIETVLVFLALAQIFPMIMHTVGQIICSSAPGSYGGRLAEVSACLHGLAAVALVGLLVEEYMLFAGLGAGVLLLLSCAAWLRFLGQLGQRLGDRTLVVDAWSYGSWLWIGFAGALFLMGGAVMVDTVGGGGPLGWVCRAGTGVIGLLLVVGYPALLHTASVAVARRGPVKHKP